MAESQQVLDILLSAEDTISHALTTMDISHSEIHEGYYFTSCLLTSTVAASSWLELEIVTPASTVSLTHIYFDYNYSAGLIEFILCEISTSSTYSHGATSITPINHYRNSTNSANTKIFYGSTCNFFLTSTATSTQAIILKNYCNGSTGTALARGISGAVRDRDEYILKSNSTTVIRIYNRAATNGWGSISAFFYESGHER